MSAVRRMLLRLPVTWPHTGKHQRGADVPAPRPDTALLAPAERQPWYQVPGRMPPRPARQRVTGTLPADVTDQWKRERGNAS